MYIRKVEQFYAKYAEIMDEESAATVEEDIRFTAKNDVLSSIVNGSEFPISQLPYGEAYSAAGETGFGWWLVEHYFSYHVNRPDGCDSGESTRGG